MKSHTMCLSLSLFIPSCLVKWDECLHWYVHYSFILNHSCSIIIWNIPSLNQCTLHLSFSVAVHLMLVPSSALIYIFLTYLSSAMVSGRTILKTFHFCAFVMISAYHTSFPHLHFYSILIPTSLLSLPVSGTHVFYQSWPRWTWSSCSFIRVRTLSTPYASLQFFFFSIHQSSKCIPNISPLQYSLLSTSAFPQLSFLTLNPKYLSSFTA